MQQIVICGPESSGKTSLSSYLSNYYKVKWIPEYAREYIGNLQRKYNYNDVELIAKQQVQQIESCMKYTDKFVIFDTGLIITKIWFTEVYKQHPLWLDDMIHKYKPDLYLLCYYDLEWKYDKLREYEDINYRAHLYELYLHEIKKTKTKYEIISGIKEKRYNLAVEKINSTLLCKK